MYYDNANISTVHGRTVNENTYVQQLSSVALKANVMDDKLQQLMERISYNQYELMRITAKMNGPAEKENINATIYDKADIGRIDFYVGAAANITKFTPHSDYELAGGSANTSKSPKVVVGVNAYANPNTRKLVFTLEMGFTQNKYKDLYENKISPYVGLIYTFNQFEVSLTPQINYNFYNGDNFKFFAGIGYNASLYSYSNKTYARQDGGPYFTNLKPFNLEKWVNSIYYKSGFLINRKFQVYASYISPVTISRERFFNITQQSLQFGVNYFF